MEVQALFLETLADLDRHLSAGDDYSMLRASALLRQLLLDGSPLVHQVNRQHKLKLRFNVCGRRYADTVLSLGPVFYSSLGGIHSSGPFPHQEEQLSLDGFLATRVLKLGDEILSIGDLISISANVLGGVHKGEPKLSKETSLVAFNERVSVHGQTLSAAQLKPIILIVREALAPLREAVMMRPTK